MAKQGANIPTTSLLDVQRLYTVDIKSPEFKELMVRLWQTVNTLSLATNMKDTGYYTLEEFINSQYFFKDPTEIAAINTDPKYRPVFRKVINFGALPNATTKSVAHGLTLTDDYKFTRIYGTATDPSTPRFGIPLPYSSATLNENIELFVDDTNITIITAIDYSSFTNCFVIIEYLKY